MAAFEALVERYSSFVKYVASRLATHLPSFVDHEDLVAYGIQGLMDAMDRFDPDRGIKFRSFAKQRIRGSILDNLRAQDFVPRSIRQRQRQMREMVALLENRLGRPPTREEMAQEMNVDVEELYALLGEIREVHILSLDAPASHEENEGPSTIDVEDQGSLSPERRIEQKDLQKRLAALIQTLPQRTALALQLHYFEELSQSEIAAIMEVSDSRVSQILKAGRERLREKLTESNVTV